MKSLARTQSNIAATPSPSIAAQNAAQAASQAVLQNIDRIINQLQSQWASQLNPLLQNPIASASTLSDISLSAGNNTVKHKLGRTPQGWWVIDVNASTVIYRFQSSDENFLYLNSSNPCTVKLAVF